MRYKISIDQIYKRDHGICAYCLQHVKRRDATRGHIVPIGKFGGNESANLALEHEHCNTERAHFLLRIKPELASEFDEEDIIDYQNGLIKPYEMAQKLELLRQARV